MKSFAKLVKDKMESKQISIRKLAKEAGLDPSFLSKVLMGKRSPPHDEKLIKQIAKILDIDPTHLIITTGTIPAELQSILEQPDFYKKLVPSNISKHLFKRSPAYKPEPTIKEATRSWVPKSPELSEDLL